MTVTKEQALLEARALNNAMRMAALTSGTSAMAVIIQFIEQSPEAPAQAPEGGAAQSAVGYIVEVLEMVLHHVPHGTDDAGHVKKAIAAARSLSHPAAPRSLPGSQWVTGGDAIVHPAAPQNEQDFRMRPASSEAAPSAEGQE